MEYAISNGIGTLLDVGHFVDGKPVSRMWESEHCMLNPAAYSNNWGDNVVFWSRAGYDVMVGSFDIQDEIV